MVAKSVFPVILLCFPSFHIIYQVRDEHRQDYDAGRGGWGAVAQRAERARRELYSDAMDGPGAVAGGGGYWESRDRAGTCYGALSANGFTHTPHIDPDSPSKGTLKRSREGEDDDDEVDELGRVSHTHTAVSTPVSHPLK